MHRIVIDTSVIVSALRSRHGASHALLTMVADEQLRPLMTVALFLEYEDVLKRAEQRLAHGLTLAQIDGFLAALASACDPVEIHFQWRPQLSDPADEMVLEAAANGRADAIVTHNVRDFVVAANRFRLRAVTPGTWLRELTP
jgi:putative PIN family toxin of toxin-antitoxin system